MTWINVECDYFDRVNDLYERGFECFKDGVWIRRHDLTVVEVDLNKLPDPSKDDDARIDVF